MKNQKYVSVLLSNTVPTTASPVPTTASPVPTNASPVPTTTSPVPTTTAPSNKKDKGILDTLKNLSNTEKAIAGGVVATILVLFIILV